MPQRPNLPLEAQAEIEKARERVLYTRLAYNLLFGLGSIDPGASYPVLRKPAILKLELQEYSSALFDAEARYYRKHARDDAELRSWLEALASHIVAEVSQEISGPLHNFHCPPSERMDTITKALEQRADHWVSAAQKDPSPATLPKGHEALTRSPKLVSAHTAIHTVVFQPSQPPAQADPSSALHAPQPSIVTPQRKGDITLLASKRAVNFKIAEQYLGISERQRQKLMKQGILAVEGKGHNRKITVESLKAYLPPENANKPEQTRTDPK